MAGLALRPDGVEMVVSGMDWRHLLLGLLCLVDCVVFIQLALADWRESWGHRVTRVPQTQRRDGAPAP